MTPGQVLLVRAFSARSFSFSSMHAPEQALRKLVFVLHIKSTQGAPNLLEVDQNPPRHEIEIDQTTLPINIDHISQHGKRRSYNILACSYYNKSFVVWHTDTSTFAHLRVAHT